MPVLSLAYLGFEVADVAAWTAFATDVLGLQVAEDPPPGGARFRVDEYAWRLTVHPGPADDLVYAGFEMPDERSTAALSRELEAKGLAVRALSSSEATRRGVGGGAVTKDPDGLDVELVYDLPRSARAFVSPQEATFVTGLQGLGHMVLATSNVERAMQFYAMLGFRVSDYIRADLGPGMSVNLVFLHCNTRHHTLAFLPVPMPKRLNHLMLEVTSVDMVLTAYYRAQARAIPIIRHMGRHTNDLMLSFYARTPAGFDVEYGFGGRQVGPQWNVTQYSAISLWGHQSDVVVSKAGGKPS
jgi:2,3-dihydroxybiphenyl 1,2-dioxygenase